MITKDSIKKVFTPKQIEVMTADQIKRPRLTICEGAVRSGKTFVLMPLWLNHIRQFKNKKFIMSGSTKSTLKSNILDDLQNLYGIDTHININGEFELFGNTVICAGADKADSYRRIKGLTAHGWLGNEITEHHKEFVNMALSRCSGHGARIYWDTNPENPEHYIKRDYIDKSGEKFSTGKVRVLSHHFRLDDNTNLTAEYIESTKADYPANSVWYKRNIEGLWVNAGNVIYTHWQKIDEQPQGARGRYDQLIAGVDFGRGGQSPFAFVLIGLNGDQVTVLFEVKQQGGINTDFIESVHSQLIGVGFSEDQIREITIYADSADPDKITEWERAGFFIKGADKSPGSVVRGIEEVMRHDLFISSGCVHTLKEIEAYEWRVDRAGVVIEEPVKVNDHFCVTGDTLIDTNKGKFKIKNLVGKNGSVLSYKNGVPIYRSFKNVMCTGYKDVFVLELTNGKEIKATADHLILTNSGWVELKNLSIHDIIIDVEETYNKEKSWRNIKSLMVSAFAWMKKQVITYKQEVKKENGFTGLCGYFTMVKFLEGLMFTIKTEIKKIIKLKTLNLLQGQSTLKNIGMKIEMLCLTLLEKTLKKLLKKHHSGTNQKMEGRGIKNMVKKHGRIGNLLNTFALNVVKFLLLLKPVRLNIVPGLVSHGITENLKSTKYKKVLIKKIENIGTLPVYNMYVDDTHCFSSNGIITHNCDALRYSVYTHFKGNGGSFLIDAVGAVEL
jgi:PBSX family phage terminase large subunit